MYYIVDIPARPFFERAAFFFLYWAALDDEEARVARSLPPRHHTLVSTVAKHGPANTKRPFVIVTIWARRGTVREKVLLVRKDILLCYVLSQR